MSPYLRDMGQADRSSPHLQASESDTEASEGKMGLKTFGIASIDPVSSMKPLRVSMNGLPLSDQAFDQARLQSAISDIAGA